MNLTVQERSELISKYKHLTQIVMPELALTKHTYWPVQEDHCFQRIVLDNVCQGRWTEFLSSPAYKNLSNKQLLDAVAVCESIVKGSLDLKELNKKSLQWRKSNPQSDLFKANY